MFTTEARMQRLLAANAKTLARIDMILSGEDTTSGKPEVDVATCTFTDAARRTKLSRPTIYKMVKAGRIRTVPLCGVSRVLVSSLDDFVNGGNGKQTAQ